MQNLRYLFVCGVAGRTALDLRVKRWARLYGQRAGASSKNRASGSALRLDDYQCCPCLGERSLSSIWCRVNNEMGPQRHTVKE